MCKISHRNSKRLLRKHQIILGDYFFAAPSSSTLQYTQCIKTLKQDDDDGGGGGGDDDEC